MNWEFVKIIGLIAGALLVTIVVMAVWEALIDKILGD